MCDVWSSRPHCRSLFSLCMPSLPQSLPGEKKYGISSHVVKKSFGTTLAGVCFMDYIFPRVEVIAATRGTIFCPHGPAEGACLCSVQLKQMPAACCAGAQGALSNDDEPRRFIAGGTIAAVQARRSGSGSRRRTACCAPWRMGGALPLAFCLCFHTHKCEVPIPASGCTIV